MLPQFTDNARNERLGIAAVQSAFSDMAWLFAERPGPDFGLDGYAEAIMDNNVTGRLIGVQVKCGKSYFKEATKTGWIFRGELKHLDYWREHTLPVIVVICDPDTKECFWVEVGPDSSIARTSAGWSIEVPSTNLLGSTSIKALTRVAANTTTEERNLARLRADTSLMLLLAEGRELRVEIEEWVNKTSGRGTFTILDVTDRDPTNEGEEIASWMLFAGGWNYAALAEALFPWANISLDDEIYDWYDEDEWASECAVRDDEDRSQVLFYTQTYEEWLSDRPDFRPYTSKGSGEIDVYRLRLDLNRLGESWLVVNEFARVLSPLEPS